MASGLPRTGTVTVWVGTLFARRGVPVHVLVCVVSLVPHCDGQILVVGDVHVAFISNTCAFARYHKYFPTLHFMCVPLQYRMDSSGGGSEAGLWPYMVAHCVPSCSASQLQLGLQLFRVGAAPRVRRRRLRAWKLLPLPWSFLNPFLIRLS